MKDVFTLTEIHVKLLNHMWVDWQNCETGAPEIDPVRPYGNSDVAGDIHEILTGEVISDYLPEHLVRSYLALHRQLDAALQIVLHTKAFEPGTYEKERYGGRWTEKK